MEPSLDDLAKASKMIGNAKTTPAEFSEAQAVLRNAVKTAKKAKLSVVGKQPEDDRQAEAFSPEETGQAAIERTTRDQLRSFVERIERLEEEKKTVAEDISQVYGEAKSTGFNAKVLRRVVAIRKMDRDERMEMEAILQTYLIALGMEE